MPNQLTVALEAPGQAKVRRVTVLGVLAFAAIAVAGETYAKWWPYAHKVAHTVATHTLQGSSIFLSAGAPGASPSWHGAWSFTVTYGLDIWPALLAAVLIGGGVEVLLPRSAVLSAFQRRGGWKSSLAGGVLALPSLMCTCCTAPITVSLRRSKVPVSGALSYWLSNPLLNPVVLVLLALVLPWQYVVVRIVIGAVLVFGAAPLVVRLVGKTETPGFSMPLPGAPTAESSGAPPEVANGPTTVVRYLRAVLRLGAYLIPEYLILVLALGAFSGWLFPLSHSAVGWGFGAVIVAAVAGTILVIPTAAELPIIIGLTALGFPIAVTGALVIALPALSLASMAMVGRSLSWRVTITMAAAVALFSLAAGGLAAAL
jgi:uncharacterized membrane protein YraQ (UPF0718 family)